MNAQHIRIKKNKKTSEPSRLALPGSELSKPRPGEVPACSEGTARARAEVGPDPLPARDGGRNPLLCLVDKPFSVCRLTPKGIKINKTCAYTLKITRIPLHTPAVLDHLLCKHKRISYGERMRLLPRQLGQGLLSALSTTRKSRLNRTGEARALRGGGEFWERQVPCVPRVQPDP